MPIRIVIYAENVADGTEIVQYAMKVGAALDEYKHVDPPIKTAQQKKTPVTRMSPDQVLDIDEEAETSYSEGSFKEKVWQALDDCVPGTRREIAARAAKKTKLTEQQAMTVVKNFIGEGVLVPSGG